MKKNENSIIDLGDARVETRGVGELGPLDIQTFQRTAHCWIQSGTTVLSDPLDRVANFTPLLTVR